MAGELLELVVGTDPHLKARVIARVEATIIDSFRQDGSRRTMNEIKRRFSLLETSMRELRAEHHWAWTRILDALPTILRCKLDGVWWDPTKQRGLWSPDQKL